MNDNELVERAARQLGEHFDTVQIIATRHEAETENGTVLVHHGTGNWFARLGSVTEWLWKNKERTNEEVRNED